MDEHEVTAITGMRRTGKTTALKYLLEKHRLRTSFTRAALLGVSDLMLTGRFPPGNEFHGLFGLAVYFRMFRVLFFHCFIPLSYVLHTTRRKINNRKSKSTIINHVIVNPIDFPINLFIQKKEFRAPNIKYRSEEESLKRLAQEQKIKARQVLLKRRAFICYRYQIDRTGTNLLML
ncbi:MAG: hypothetical protein R3A50_09370 [Saprospiraceae bacterium]